MRLPWLVVLLPLAACGPDSTTTACKDSFIAGDLVITEVFADYAAPDGGTGTDDGKEWFEIYNNTDRPVSLKGMSIVHSRQDGSKAKTHTMTDVTVAPGQYFTLGNATQDLLPPYVDYGFSADLGDFYNTGGGQLALQCGDQEIDSAVYDLVSSGHSRQLTSQSPPDYTLNDDQTNWCEANDTEFELNNFGTPGSESDCAPVIAGMCDDAGVSRSTVAPQPGDLVITEVMPDPDAASDTVGEWFEVYANADVDLNGLTLDRAGDTAMGNVLDSQSCLHVAAGEYAVFARSDLSTSNGNLPNVKGTFSFSLINGTAAAPGDVQISFGGAVLDAITWTSTRTARSHQLDPDRIDTVQNDDETSFCDAMTPYNSGMSTDYGTPGVANEACPTTVGPGQCMDNGTPRAIVPPPMGDLVISEFMPDPAAVSDTVGEWFEVTNVGASAFDMNGLALDREADSRKPDTITSTNCISVPAAGYALFARSSDPTSNGGLPDVDATFGFSMVSSGGNARVVDPASCDLVTSPYPCTTIFDAVTWPSASSGVALQLDPTMLTTTANDDSANFCAATMTYGTAATDKGTPKADNTACP